MERVSVRELRQRASVWLRRVQAGESFEVTNRGRAVAVLGPLPRGDRRDQLIAAGRLIAGHDDLLRLGSPLVPEPGLPPASVVLEQLRADER